MRLHWYWNFKNFLGCIPIKTVHRLSTVSYVSRSMEETWYIWFSKPLQSFDLKLVKNEYLNSPKFHKGSVQTSFTHLFYHSLFFHPARLIHPADCGAICLVHISLIASFSLSCQCHNQFSDGAMERVRLTLNELKLASLADSHRYRGLQMAYYVKVLY